MARLASSALPPLCIATAPRSQSAISKATLEMRRPASGNSRPVARASSGKSGKNASRDERS